MALEQYGIAKLVRAIVMLSESRGDPIQRRCIGKGAEELKMAFPRLMHAGENRIRDAQPGFTDNTPARNPGAGAHATVGISR